MSLYTRNILILICLYPWSVKHKIFRLAIEKDKACPPPSTLRNIWGLQVNYHSYPLKVMDVMAGPWVNSGDLKIVIDCKYFSLPCTGRSKFPELSAVVTPALIWPSERRRCSMPSFFFTKKLIFWNWKTRVHIIKINFHSSSGVHIKVVLDDMVSFS